MLKITVIHGQSHKGSTYNITKRVIHEISSDEKEIYEYFMPKDVPDYCVGCFRCFNESEDACPHAIKVQRIVTSMEISDIVIIDSPTYCFEMTGQLKTLFDHFGYMWLPHRPRVSMFNKIAIVISTASGSGAAKVTKSLAQQMFWIGIPKIFRYSKNINASSWETVSSKIKESIEEDTYKLSKKVNKSLGNLKPSVKLKFMFSVMRKMQKSNDWNKTDRNYWESNGWLYKERPW